MVTLPIIFVDLEIIEINRYHPSVNKEFIQKHRNYVESILNGITYDKITIEHFAQVIQCALYLDKFQDFCSENMKEEEDDGIARTYLQVRNTPENGPTKINNS